jgi:hypothetical protein
MALFDPVPRRRLLAVLAAASPMLVAQRRRAVRATTRLDRSALAALAEVVLPSEIGAEGRAAAVAAFDRWLQGYRAGAELLHGYGQAEIRQTPPSPAPRFEVDLATLDQAARRTRGRPFAGLSIAERRPLVETAIGAAPQAIPATADATHVAVALLAHWAESAAGYDLAYRARINRFACRPLATNPDRPSPAGDQ